MRIVDGGIMFNMESSMMQSGNPFFSGNPHRTVQTL